MQTKSRRATVLCRLDGHNTIPIFLRRRVLRNNDNLQRVLDENKSHDENGSDVSRLLSAWPQFAQAAQVVTIAIYNDAMQAITVSSKGWDGVWCHTTVSSPEAKFNEARSYLNEAPQKSVITKMKLFKRFPMLKSVKTWGGHQTWCQLAEKRHLKAAST